jgi:hypothetical protein
LRPAVMLEGVKTSEEGRALRALKPWVEIRCELCGELAVRQAGNRYPPRFCGKRCQNRSAYLRRRPPGRRRYVR